MPFVNFNVGSASKPTMCPLTPPQASQVPHDLLELKAVSPLNLELTKWKFRIDKMRFTFGDGGVSVVPFGL